MISTVGADRVLLGSDYPFDMGVSDPVQRVEAAELGAADTHAITSGNAESLGLTPRAHPIHKIQGANK